MKVNESVLQETEFGGRDNLPVSTWCVHCVFRVSFSLRLIWVFLRICTSIGLSNLSRYVDRFKKETAERKKMERKENVHV